MIACRRCYRWRVACGRHPPHCWTLPGSKATVLQAQTIVSTCRSLLGKCWKCLMGMLRVVEVVHLAKTSEFLSSKSSNGLLLVSSRPLNTSPVVPFIIDDSGDCCWWCCCWWMSGPAPHADEKRSQESSVQYKLDWRRTSGRSLEHYTGTNQITKEIGRFSATSH